MSYRIYIYIPFKSNRIHIFFKYTWNILHGRSHVRLQISHSKFKKIEIILSIYSDHNEINYKKKTGKNTNIGRLNNMLLNSQSVNEEIKEEIKNTMR